MKLTPAALSAIFSGNIENAIAAITPGGIEAQEKAGQTEFVSNSMLPKEMLHGCTREKLEKMGIKFGNDIDDPLFVAVKLPEGWIKQPTEHSMWSELLDNKGRKRANIFYKAAFYDRKAHISLNCRYGFSVFEPCDADGNPASQDSYTHLKAVAKDGDTIIQTLGVYSSKDYSKDNELRKEAVTWLNEHFPNWKDENAYWEEGE